ncbi:MAG: ABC transporter permease [Chloroflexi bacterium]|nr:ABC transporter permease [Chloroflexota bacterium]
MKLLQMASFTFREALRKKALYAATGLTLVFLGLYALGTHYAFLDIDHSARLPVIAKQVMKGQILLAGLYVIANVGALLAIFVASGTISSEIDSGTIQSIVPKPIRRWEVVLGKWLGYALMLACYVGITGAASMAIVYILGGHFPDNLAVGLALMVLKSLLLLSLAMLGSTFLSTLTTGIVVFILYALGNVGGLIEEFGMLIQNQTLVNIGIISGLVIPSDVLWKLSASLFLSGTDLMAMGLANYAGPFTSLNPPSVWMAVYSLAYVGLALAASVAIFQRRDL